MRADGKRIFEQLRRDPSLDIVIDTTWAVSNMVMGACHHIFDYSTNFWANYIYAFNALYLHPLVTDWSLSTIINAN
jgi:hypothetical protein